VANLTASRISTERVRKLRFFQPQEYISVDYGRQDVLQFQVAAGQKFSAAQLLAMATAPGAVPIPGVSMNKPAVVSEEPLHAELKSFLSAVRSRTRPEIPLEDGRRALDVALQILAAISEHNRQAGIQVL
jgi:predicted dehydrogenase